MTEELEVHQELIHKLAPAAQKPGFNRLLNEHTSGMSNESRFLIKMEMQRLAKPCVRAIDLRDRVDGECQLYSFGGIKHYLHDAGLARLEALTVQYGAYTFGVYEAVQRLSKVRLDQAALQAPDSASLLMGGGAAPSAQTQASEKDKAVQDESKSNSLDKYLSPYQSLINYPSRKQERLNYVLQVQLQLEGKAPIDASTVDISEHGLRLKLQDSFNLQDLNVEQEIAVIFSGFSPRSGVNTLAVQYKILDILGRGDNARISLHLSDEDAHPDITAYLAQFIESNKRRYKVNVDHSMWALENKVFEQAFAMTTPVLPLFIDSSDILAPFAAYTCINEYNKELRDYWTDEEGHNQIGMLLEPQRLIELIANEQQSILVFCFNYIKQERIYFYSASYSELQATPELFETFLSYASRKVSWKVFSLQATSIEPQDAYMPTSLGMGLSPSIDRANEPLPNVLQNKLAPLSHMVSVTDVTSSHGQQIYHKYALEKDKVTQIVQFGHAKNKAPHEVASFPYIHRDLRKETRYRLRTAVTVFDGEDHLNSVSEDISLSGLKLGLEKPFSNPINSRVSLSFPNLQRKTQNFVLKDLEYRVRHISDDGLILRLEVISDQNKETAQAFFEHLISLNKDTLKSAINEEAMPGMGNALRCIQAKNTPAICAFMHRLSIGYVPLNCALNQSAQAAASLLRHQAGVEQVNLSWLFEDKNSPDAFIKKSLSALKYNPRPIHAEIYLAFDEQHEDIDDATEAQWEYELSSHRSKYRFIHKALQEKHFFAFKVVITQVSVPDTSLLDQEFGYVGQYAIHKAKQIEDLMWGIAGQVHLIDITDEVLVRYHLHPKLP